MLARAANRLEGYPPKGQKSDAEKENRAQRHVSKIKAREDVLAGLRISRCDALAGAHSHCEAPSFNFPLAHQDSSGGIARDPFLIGPALLHFRNRVPNEYGHN